MPAYQTPLELPNTDLACIFRPDFPFDFCLGLWSIYGMLVNSGIESWVTQMICKGKVESIDTTAPYILTNAYSDYPKVFAETYDGLMAKYGSLLETFVDDATQDTWDPRSGKPKGLSTGPMSSFLLLETRLGVRSFFSAFSIAYAHMEDDRLRKLLSVQSALGFRMGLSAVYDMRDDAAPPWRCTPRATSRSGTPVAL